MPHRPVIIHTAFCLALLFSCQKAPSILSPTEAVQTYYDGINAFDFDLTRSVLTDSIALIEGEYQSLLSQEQYYTLFQWDSVFVPQVTLSNIKEEGNQVTVLVSTSSVRLAYLDHAPHSCNTTFIVESGKIQSLETGECPEESRPIWESKRDTLVTWIDANHPELNGFIHDLTKTGAENYVKAIRLYEDRMSHSTTQ